MRQRTPTSIPLFVGAFAPVLSLDALTAQRDAEGRPSFDIRDDAPQPDAQLEEAQGRAAVNDFVDSLPPRDQEIVKRLFWQDETQTQIAVSFRVSKMAISKAMARIAKRGRALLADHRDLTFNG
jgi:RNA polymerase sigma factor (sigma-70 family)